MQLQSVPVRFVLSKSEEKENSVPFGDDDMGLPDAAA